MYTLADIHICMCIYFFETNANTKTYLRTAPDGLLTAMCWVTEPEAGMVEEEGGSSCNCIDFGTAALKGRN